jgi:hypothetical protein
MFPIYIPSIYRHDSDFLIRIRDTKPSLKYYIIIASHQLNDYAKIYPSKNLVILPDNIIKISEIRQFILDLAIKNKETKIWMSDDDLSRFFIKMKKDIEKDIKKDIEKDIKKERTTLHLEHHILEKLSSDNQENILDEVSFKDFLTNAEMIFNKLSILDTSLVQFGFKYSTFSIPLKPITLNSNVGMIQFLDIERIKTKIQKEELGYDSSFIALEDTDFTIQLFNNGFKNCILNHYIFTAPRSGHGKGGLEKAYSEGAKQKGIQRFMVKYKNLITITNLENDKYKILWNKFKNLQLEKELGEELGEEKYK